MPESSPAFRRQGIDKFVWLAGLDDLTPLNVTPLAQLGELAVNLLMVSLPEKADRRIKGLGELITGHRMLGQAGQNGITKRQRSQLLHFGKVPSASLTLCIKAHMRQYAYRVSAGERAPRNGGGQSREVWFMGTIGPQRWREFATSRDTALLWDLLDPDVVFESPVVHTPQRGREVTLDR